MPEQEPIRRDPKYRPNYRRSIAISGIIDDAQVSRLLPEIVKLQAASRDPITVYIDSPGGDTECAKLLLEALRAGDQDGAPPCRLITVALGQACSAASDLLMAGDYALAYPYSRILCHVTRILLDTSFTRDQAANFATWMAGQDETFALTLARNCIDRFMFRISQICRTMESLDSKKQSFFGQSEVPAANFIARELCKFLQARGCIRSAISEQIEIAGESAQSVFALASSLHLSNGTDKKEAVRQGILKEALDRASSETDFNSLETTYRLLCDFFEKDHRDMIQALSYRWSSDLYGRQKYLEDAPFNESGRAKRIKDRINGRCFSLWFLFVFFCRQLQTGDFPMMATEAYWLGLIDEVVGAELPSPRILVENAPDIPDPLE